MRVADAIVDQKVEHCDECGVCILGLDHHCVFFDACIGTKNFCLFITVIVSFFVLLILAVVFAAVA